MNTLINLKCERKDREPSTCLWRGKCVWESLWLKLPWKDSKLCQNVPQQFILWTRKWEKLRRICYTIASSSVKYFCANSGYVRSNWTTFTKQQEVGNIRDIITTVFDVFQNMYLLLIFWFLSVSSNCSVHNHTTSLR